MKTLIILAAILVDVVHGVTEASYDEHRSKFADNILSDQSCSYLKKHNLLDEREKLRSLCLGTKEYSHVGCFKDDISSRALPDFKNIQSIKECARIAKELGFAYFGIQFGGECWTGDGQYNKYGPGGNCKNGKGGDSEMDVYKVEGCRDSMPGGCCDFLKAKNLCDYSDIAANCQYTCLNCQKPSCKERQPLGMHSKEIVDSQITASSTYSISYPPANARLNAVTNGWCPKTAVKGVWLQIDLKKPYSVTAVATQGAAGYWTKTYTLQYSNDGNNFKTYGKDKIFNGNIDALTAVTQTLDPPIRARYVRFYPETWHAGWPYLRVELYGCK